jgi:hypothetical protein
MVNMDEELISRINEFWTSGNSVGGRVDLNEAWRTAKSFSDLCVLNRKFLRGEIEETPYHCGPIVEETIPLVESLLRLHDFQMLTHNSQPYTDAYPSLFEGKWYQGKQRPYVSFVVPRKHAVSLFRKLKERQEVVVMASDIYGKVLKDSHKMVTVTRERVADTAEDIVRE